MAAGREIKIMFAHETFARFLALHSRVSTGLSQVGKMCRCVAKFSRPARLVSPWHVGIDK
jgi:hypothetical protein